MSMKKLSGIALAAAAALAFSTISLAGDEHANPNAEAGKVKCDGGNACKTHSSCKTAHNACKGQNACKGKGFTMEASQKACEDARAKNAAAK